MKCISLSFVFASVVSLAPVCMFAYGSADMHAKDFVAVINGYDDYRLRQFYKKFSSDIDSNRNAETSTSLSAQIKRAIAAKYKVDVKSVHFYHKHRYIAHQWKYQGNIPYEDLQLISKYYPDCLEDIKNIWQRFCRGSNDYIASEFALQRSPWIAKAYCAILYYTHIICDWLPEVNRDYDYLMSLDNVLLELVGVMESMGRSEAHKNFCKEFESKLKAAKALGGGSEQQQAVHMLRALKEMRIGTMLHERFGPYMDESRHPYKEDAEQQLRKAA